ncbi:large ribosomal subunit protein mL62 [Anas acuta]|uniref:large ribosomal subunit protein mL62 n=1 Tax=Anas acuta TaxID=28680 RepID=UPI000F7C3662|nr:peptidyl-tRNA hydrolase ICT1, mitochondrial [Anas platyrhynchos]|eukprot:XP_027327336.1 peptidyl-tRNA hydrolase ICT1, mitochondrial [Anas platyrhynchos]
MAARTLRALCRPRLLAAGFSRRAAAGAEFRSAYSLDKLYPPRGGDTGDTGSVPEQEAKPPALDIPMDRLTVSYSRSSGPGGQNVNKVNTKAEVRFHLASADWIPEAVRQKMASMHKNKINRAGELIVNSEESRYQMRNLAICLEKIRVMVTEATEKPKVMSKETAQELIARVEKMNRERLRQKKIHSNIKQSRKADFD